MGKYDPLHDYLFALSKSTGDITLSFKQIEEILGANLPRSAFRHRPWWTNEYSPSGHVQAQAWLAAGWKVDTVNQSEHSVRFSRE